MHWDKIKSDYQSSYRDHQYFVHKNTSFVNASFCFIGVWYIISQTFRNIFIYIYLSYMNYIIR